MNKLFKSYNTKVQLTLVLLCNIFLWLSFNLIWYKVWPADEQMSWRGIVFKATFMGIFWTLIFSWKLVKQYFSKHER